MTKPAVYNYKTAEDKIARLKQLVLFMGETVNVLSKDNNRLKEKTKLLQAENNRLEYLVNNAWIPITEREPDTAEHVLVTIKWAEESFEVCELDYGVTHYEATITKLPCLSKDIINHVIAWRPMPEAYREG